MYFTGKYFKITMISKVLVLIILIGAINDVVAFTCGDQCWHNDWRTRDSEASNHNLGHLRCSHSYGWGGKCFCYGPPQCIKVPAFTCDHNCWHNDWKKRDERARAAGMYDRRCSYNYRFGGQCYCYGKPLCK